MGAAVEGKYESERTEKRVEQCGVRVDLNSGEEERKRGGGTGLKIGDGNQVILMPGKDCWV